MKRLQDNKGFTLIEILLSIAILMILILPVLNHFVMAGKVNQKANRMQKATALAGNIMESIASYELEDIALEFNDKSIFKFLPSNPTAGTGNTASSGNYIVKPYSENGYGEYVQLSPNSLVKVNDESEIPSSVTLKNGSYVFQPPVDRKQFIFALEELLVEGLYFDSVITVDRTVYSDNSKYPNTMNNYRLPRLYELNNETVSIIDPYGSNITWSDESEAAVPYDNNQSDVQAVADFYNIYLAHLAYLENQPIPTAAPTPTPRPITYTLEDIKSSTNKELLLHVTRVDNSTIEVNASIIYSCNLDLNEDGSKETLHPFTIMDGTYPLERDSEVNHPIYIFYMPSEFTNRDTITVKNQGVKANVYIANQNEMTTSKVKIKNEEISGATTYFYTNLLSHQMADFYRIENQLFMREDKKDRVYEISVAIYPSGSIKKKELSNPYITLYSTREE